MSIAGGAATESAYEDAERIVSTKIAAYRRRLRGVKDMPVEQFFKVLGEIRDELQRESDGVREGY